MATDDKAEAAYLADLEGQVATLTARFVDQEAKLGLSLKKRTRQRDALIRREQDLAKLLSSKDKEIKLLKNQQKAVASELGGENEHLLAQASDYASTLVAVSSPSPVAATPPPPAAVAASPSPLPSQPFPPRPATPPDPTRPAD